MICSLSIELTYLIPRRSGLRGETLGNCKSETEFDDSFEANRLNGCMPHTAPRSRDRVAICKFPFIPIPIPFQLPGGRTSPSFYLIWKLFAGVCYITPLPTPGRFHTVVYFFLIAVPAKSVKLFVLLAT
jgi:hypothetical protein